KQDELTDAEVASPDHPYPGGNDDPRHKCQPSAACCLRPGGAPARCRKADVVCLQLAPKQVLDGAMRAHRLDCEKGCERLHNQREAPVAIQKPGCKRGTALLS